jgi:hypothetical protein
MPTGEGGVRVKDNLAMCPKELNIKELQKARLAKKRPTERRIHETHQGLPFACLKAVGQQKGNFGIRNW